ncbi:MAG TPA: MarR family transcriptional regulator [Rubrivivax sp.]|nr:MarR family transcriptional regulator [Burkholderiales bacterium]HNT40156.1 MarR family transcriptional regulator [Rubrivivax sp.]
MERRRPGRAGLKAATAAAELSYGTLPTVLGYHLRRTQVAIFRHFSRTVAAQTGITPGLLGMLQVIAANPGLAQSRLAEAMEVDRSTIVKVVDQLEARGLIVREPSPSDKRSYGLRLTKNGEAELPRFQRLMKAHEDEFAAPLSAAERRQLIALLARLYERAHEDDGGSEETEGVERGPAA